MGAMVYLIKVSIALMLFYLVYKLVFSRLTFFRFNRFYLLFAFSASLLLPFLVLPTFFVGSDPMFSIIGIDWDELMQLSDTAVSGGIRSIQFPMFYVILSVYIAVSSWRLVRSFMVFSKVRKLYSDGVIETHRKIRLNIHPKISAPFTMFRTVYLDRHTYEQKNSPVLRHEIVHARELHSLDLLISEIICAFLWFNPFVFLLKHQIRENHEFLADHSAHSDSSELIGYMQALSSEFTRNLEPAVASYFQSSTLKKRVIMLTNKRSSRRKQLLYLTVLPLVALMVMAFQQPADRFISDSPVVKLIKEQAAMPLFTDADGIPSRFPMDSKYKKLISWEYGKKAKNPITGEMQVHKGVDIAAPRGAAVFASGSGVIAKVTTHEGYGKVIVIKHEDQISSLYAHLDSFNVEAGEEVQKGDLIGTVGNTGKSTGPHLHYEVRKEGKNVDPNDYY